MHDCPLPVRLRVLRAVEYFRDLPDEDLLEIDRRMIAVHFATGDTIHRFGDRAEYYFVVAQGGAKAVQVSVEGQAIVLDVLAPGDLFGGLESLGMATYPETVQTLTETCVLRIDSARFHEVLQQFPAVSLRVIESVSDQLRQARTTITDQATKPVRGRVAAMLLRLADKFGADRDGQTLIQLPLTRVDLAALAGSTPESVSRVMSQFRRDGLIDSGRRWTSVVDRAALESIRG